MASNLRVDTILPSTGTSLGIGTASGTTTVTGNLVASSASFTGNLGIAGVLTYEDVTNVDSVGIVTAGTGLVVGSTSRSSTNVHIKSSTTGQGEIRFADDVINAGYIKYQHSDNALLFATNTLERLRITAAGDLEIKGSGEGGPKVFRDGGSGPDIVLHGSRGTIASPTASAGTDLLGNINFAGYDGSEYHRRATINGVIDGTVVDGSNTVPTALIFRTGTTGATERLRISSSGIVTKPYLPAWSMHGTGVQSLSSATKLAFSVNGTGFGSFTNRNHGGVNTSDNSYTVPVTGLYSVSVVIFFYNNSNTNTISIVPRINGNELSNGTDTVFFCGMKPYQNNGTISGTLLLQLAANDKITIHRRDGESGSDNVYLAHSVFMGHLVG